MTNAFRTLDSSSLIFANSIDYARLTGGFVYNTRLMAELAARGWHVERLEFPAGFPRPDDGAIARTAQLLAALPDDTLVAADQICFSPIAEIVERAAARLRPVMLFHHPIALEAGLPDEERARFAQLERRALAACRLVITTSHTTAEMLRSDYDVPDARIVVALPGMSRAQPSAPSDDADMVRLLSIGAVIERKGHHLLVDALAGLADVPWRLDIVGDLERAPAHVARLRERIAAAGLTGRIVLRGGLSPEALEELWQSAHAYVAASVHEGFGMAVAEAIARGVPTVTTASGAIGEWLDPEAALIVPNGSAGALRAAIQRVLTEPPLRSQLRKGALAQAARLPSWGDAADVVGERLAQL